MNERDIRGVLWVLEEIEKNNMIRSYFQQNLDLRNTDLAILIKQFRDIERELDNPMYNKGDNMRIPIILDLMITK